jgi:hypothetical protein
VFCPLLREPPRRNQQPHRETRSRRWRRSTGTQPLRPRAATPRPRPSAPSSPRTTRSAGRPLRRSPPRLLHPPRRPSPCNPAVTPGMPSRPRRRIRRARRRARGASGSGTSWRPAGSGGEARRIRRELGRRGRLPTTRHRGPGRTRRRRSTTRASCSGPCSWGTCRCGPSARCSSRSSRHSARSSPSGSAPCRWSTSVQRHCSFVSSSGGKVSHPFAVVLSADQTFEARSRFTGEGQWIGRQVSARLPLNHSCSSST